MRNYRTQTIINIFRLALSGEESLANLASYLWWWLKPARKKIIRPNKFFDVRDLTSLRQYAHQMAEFDPVWFPRLIEPTTRGIRTWEYGMLLSNLSFSNKKILDLGVGSSRLPYYLSHLSGKITAVDLHVPMEEEIILENHSVKWVSADMTRLPFKDNSFDIVLNISAMEHLDADYPANLPVSRRLFISRTRKTTREMVRVCKKGGLIYITTDFFLSSQITDNWKTQVKYKDIGGAYRSEDLKIFISEFELMGCKMVGDSSLDFDLLEANEKYSNFRGRYFTTAALLYRKP